MHTFGCFVVHVSLSSHVCACVCLCVYVCAYVYMCVCVCVCMCVCVCVCDTREHKFVPVVIVQLLKHALASPALDFVSSHVVSSTE